MSTVRVAVVGLGVRGLATAEVLGGMFALGALCDTDPGVLVDAGAAFEGIRLESDYLRVLASADVAAVVLCTPPATWDGMVEAALQAGKDVYVDGPLVLPLARGQALVERAQGQRRLLMAGPVVRFAPVVEALLRVVRAGELGPVRYVHAHHYKAAPAQGDEVPDAGLSAMQAQLLLDLLDAPPTRVLTRGTTWRSARVPDVTETLLEVRDGPRALLHASHVAPFGPGGGFELTVLGETGAARLWRDDEDRLHVAFQGEAAVDAPPPSHGHEARTASLNHFLDSVRTRRPPLQGPDALLGLWRLLAAAQRSLDEGGAVDPSGLSGPSAPAPTASRTFGPGVFVHPTVQVDGPCEIGAGTKIWHFSKLLGPLTIGRDCSFGQNVVIERNVTIGDNVKVQNNVSLYSGVILEDDVFCGPSMVFTNIGTPRSHYPRKGQYATTRVQRGASIGANATVVCGHTLGQYCFVGAGAVVTRDVPDYALVYGNPARVMGFACYCGARLPFGIGLGECQEAACADCGRRYAREGHQVVMLAES